MKSFLGTGRPLTEFEALMVADPEQFEAGAEVWLLAYNSQPLIGPRRRIGRLCGSHQIIAPGEAYMCRPYGGGREVIATCNAGAMAYLSPGRGT